MVLTRSSSTGGVSLEKIISTVKDKEKLYRIIGYIALRNAVASGDYSDAWKIIVKYSRYVPEFKKILGMYNTLSNTYRMIQGYMDTLLQCVREGNTECVSRIYNEELQALIPPAIETARRLGIDTKQLEGIEWLAYGLLYATRLVHDINDILAGTPRITGNTPQQLSEQFIARAKYYSNALQRIRSVVERYEPMIVDAINHLRNLGISYYRVLDNILGNIAGLEKQLVAMEDVDVSLSKAFRGLSEIENALVLLDRYGFDTARPYLVKGLLDLAGAIKELRVKETEYGDIDIASANGVKTSIGGLISRYIDYFTSTLKNIVDSLAKTGDPRIIDVLRNNTLGLVSIPEGYEEKPVFRQISEAIHYIIDANKKLFNQALDNILSGNIWDKPLLGVATLGVIGSSLIDAFTMIFRPDELRQQISFLINGLKTLITNPEGWAKGSWNIIKEMFSTPYMAVYTLSTMIALPLASEGLAEILSKKTPLLRSIGELLQADPLGTTTKILEIVRTTPKARLLLRRLGIEDKVEALLLGREAGDTIRKIISTSELDDIISRYILSNYRELAETLGDELKRIRATNIHEYIRILRELAEKKQEELLRYIVSRSQLQRTVSEDIRSLLGKPVEITLSSNAVRRILEKLPKNTIDYREAISSLERLRSSLKKYIESLDRLGIDTSGLEKLVSRIDRAIGDIISSTTGLGDTLNTLRSSIVAYLEEARHPVTLDSIRKELVETITRIENRLDTIITRIKQLEAELPSGLREDAIELYNALRILRDKIDDMMKNAEADPVGTLLDIDKMIRNVLSQYKTVIDRVDILSMHLRNNIFEELNRIMGNRAVVVKKAIDEGIIPQLLRLREIALQLRDENIARQIDRIAYEIQSSPIYSIADTIEKIMPRLEGILTRIEDRIMSGKQLPTDVDRILHAIDTIRDIGSRLRKMIKESPLLYTLEKYIDSFTVRARNMLGVARIEVEPTVLSGIVHGLVDGLDYIRRLSPEMYDRLKPYIDTLVEDIGSGRILERDVRAVENIVKILRREPVVPHRLYSSLYGLLEKTRPLTRYAEKLLGLALSELKRIYPLRKKAVFILGSIDEAEARKIPLIMTDPEHVSIIRHMFTGEYVFKSDGYTIKRYGEIGRNTARITYYVEKPGGYWAKLIIDIHVDGNPLNAFIKGGNYRVTITKAIIYDPDNPMSRATAKLLMKDLDNIERGAEPEILRDIEYTRYIYIPVGNGELEPLFRILVSAPALLQLPRQPSTLDDLRQLLLDLLKQYGVIVFNVNGKMIRVTSSEQLDKVLDMLGKQGVTPADTEVEITGQQTITSTRTAGATAQGQVLTATYYPVKPPSPPPYTPPVTSIASHRNIPVVIVSSRHHEKTGHEYEELVL